MEAIARFLRDMLDGFRYLHTLARTVKISPRHMTTFTQHAAYNASAFSVIAALLLVSIGFYTPNATVGVGTAVLSTILALAFVGFVGYFVNIIEPADGVFVDDGDPPAPVLGLANKWATYFALNFFTMLVVFIGVNGLTSMVTDNRRSAVGYLMDADITYHWAALVIVGICALLATAIVFACCRTARKIHDGLTTTLTIFILTNAVCGTLFYFLHFSAFV